MDLSGAGLLALTSLSLAEIPKFPRRNSLHIPRKTSWGTPIIPPSSRKAPVQTTAETIFDEVDLHAESMESLSSRDGHTWNTLDNIAALGLSFNLPGASSRTQPMLERFSLEDPVYSNCSLLLEKDRPFNKWVKKLEQRVTRRRKTLSCDTRISTTERDLLESPSAQRRFSHKKSSSGSSFGFVTAMKSASMSLASFSVAPKSKKTIVSSRQQRTDRSSKASHLGRTSEDSTYIARGIVIDQAVTNRLLQRRRVLEEMINTEESYVADVKFLMNVYITLLASIPSMSLNFKASINRNLNEMLELHEELLGDLHRVVPHSEYTQTRCPDLLLQKPSGLHQKGHQRWHSLDAVPETSGGVRWLQKIPGMTAEPKVAAEVARIFSKRVGDSIGILVSFREAYLLQMNRFFVYEEYGAKYEMMIKDVASAYRTIPQWEVFQKGLETLASSLASINNQEDNAKKAMTIGDLLVKPIQRVCKYPLLFSELLKQTPVCDCPDSHMEIENVLIRLREATTEINRATDDPRMKALLEKSWLLQDRLIFPDMLEARSLSAIRSLGHIHLCGVLHVSWQTKNGVDGQYLICLLYRDFLLLASASECDQTYTVRACIALCEVGIEEVDNGRGLQCHTVQFSWKLVFESDHQLFEFFMSACSPREEFEWRRRLTDRSSIEPLIEADHTLYSSLYLPVEPLGTVFGKPGTIARRISIHRAKTNGPTSGRYQVIIKNTNDFKETSSSAAIKRSQSLFTTNRVPVLATSRAERTRLEALLSDVWTREILPFPGMAYRARSDHLVRASASSMMRKLSVASIASNFTKRSGSMASLHKAVEDDQSSEHDAVKSAPIRAERYSAETKLLDAEDTMRSRLSVIQDEKENMPQKDSFESFTAMIFGLNSSPASTTRSPTLKPKNWGLDGHRIITPPPRTSSANSTGQIRLGPFPVIADAVMEDKETLMAVVDAPHLAWKDGKKGKVIAKGRSVVAEGIRNFFR